MSRAHLTPFIAAAAATLVVGGIGAWYLLYAAPGAEVTGVAYNTATSTHPLPALPERLRVPKLAIDAAIQKVGKTKAGLMANPTNFTDVGWYAPGPRPGQDGSAVIAGHVDNALALSGVFKHLEDLAVGDDLYVDTEGTTTEHFRVVERQIYPYDQVPLEKVFGRADGAYLNLITCSGAWLKDRHTYDHRLIVYAQLVE